jgi:hypothetical protein
MKSIVVGPYPGAAARDMTICWTGGYPSPGDPCPTGGSGRVRCIPDGRAPHVDILTYDLNEIP